MYPKGQHGRHDCNNSANQLKNNTLQVSNSSMFTYVLFVPAKGLNDGTTLASKEIGWAFLAH